jgi:hypothetical protein
MASRAGSFGRLHTRTARPARLRFFPGCSRHRAGRVMTSNYGACSGAFGSWSSSGILRSSACSFRSSCSENLCSSERDNAERAVSFVYHTKYPGSTRSRPSHAPNIAFQPTPLRGRKIAGILHARFMLILVPIYTAARLNASRSAQTTIWTHVYRTLSVQNDMFDGRISL